MPRLGSAEPTIKEMRHDLSRPEGIDFHPLVSKHYLCVECGTGKADWWLTCNGVRRCNVCAQSRVEQ